MIDFQSGQRVELTRTHDASNPPHVGQQGFVLAYERTIETVTVAWDDGTVTPVRPADGDGLAVLDDPRRISEDAWQQLLATVTACGANDGHRAYDAWSREHAGHDPAQLRGTARQILRSLHDDQELDPSQAPQYDTSSFAQPPTSQQLSQLLAALGVAGTPPVPETWRRQADWKYRDAFEITIRERAGDWARRVLIPQAGGRDFTELHRDQIRIGRAGVFSGDWMWTSDDDGPDYLRTGFVGTLIDRWNGWAVFSCTRQIAEAIVEEQQRLRAHEQEVLQASGMSPKEARDQVDTTLADLHFDGDDIVADQRVMFDDPQAIERLSPDADGRYVVMGRNWCWEAVHPYDCDHLVGDLPAPGAEQQFVLLTHTPGMRVPHQRLFVRVDNQRPVAGGMAYVGALVLDGKRVSTVGDDAAGSGPDLVVIDPAAAEPLRLFLAGCRWQDQPVSWPRLLDALAGEAYLGADVAQATAEGGTLLRQVDDAGYTRQLRPLPAQPAGWDELAQLAAALPASAGRRWEIWTGRSWFLMPTRGGRS